MPARDCKTPSQRKSNMQVDICVALIRTCPETGFYLCGMFAICHYTRIVVADESRPCLLLWLLDTIAALARCSMDMHLLSSLSIAGDVTWLPLCAHIGAQSRTFSLSRIDQDGSSWPTRSGPLLHLFMRLHLLPCLCRALRPTIIVCSLFPVT